MAERRAPGRPVGRRYPHTKSVKLREVDVQRLRLLAAKMDRDESWVIRHAVELLANQQGVHVD